MAMLALINSNATQVIKTLFIVTIFFVLGCDSTSTHDTILNKLSSNAPDTLIHTGELQEIATWIEDENAIPDLKQIILNESIEHDIRIIALRCVCLIDDGKRTERLIQILDICLAQYAVSKNDTTYWVIYACTEESVNKEIAGMTDRFYELAGDKTVTEKLITIDATVAWLQLAQPDNADALHDLVIHTNLYEASRVIASYAKENLGYVKPDDRNNWSVAFEEWLVEQTGKPIKLPHYKRN